MRLLFSQTLYLAAFLLLLLAPQGTGGSFPELHDLKWSSSRIEDELSVAARSFYGQSRAKREAGERSLFESEEEYDEEDEKIMGSLFTQFLADSNDQLILDLDFFHHFFNYAEAYKLGMQEGNIDYVKIAMKVVEKLKQFDISAACTSDMFHLVYSSVEYATLMEESKNCTNNCTCTPQFRQKADTRAWIFSVLDSIGKVPSGILGGNNLWVGSWNTCRNIKVVKNAQGQFWNGQYCLTHLSAYERDNPLKKLGNSGPVDAHCYETGNVSTPVEDDGKCFELIPMLNFGVCVPDTCTDYDVTRMITFFIRMAEGAIGREAVCDVTVECRKEISEKPISQNNLALWAIFILVSHGVTMLFGTLYDLFIYQKQLVGLNPAQAKEHLIHQHLFIKIILFYSVYTNGKDYLSTNAKETDVTCLHGMRVLSMFWIILGHTYYYIARSLTTDNLIPTLVNFPQMFYTQMIVQAPLAVDAFFFLSGLLGSLLMFRNKLSKPETRNHLFNPLLWISAPFYRYLRITPLYAMIMLVDVSLTGYVSSGPFWTPIEKTGCQHTWWVNLLYMNNFLLQDVECCMGWTWYLANDFQFHLILTTILVMAYAKRDKVGYIVSAILMAASAVIKMWLMVANDFPPAPLLTAKLQIVKKLDAYWNDVYVRPYIRCGPFIAGITVAYLLFKLPDHRMKYKMKTKYLVLGWTISTILGLYSVFGLFEYSRTGDISEVWKILYVLAGRPAFTVALSWVAFVCATGNGGPVGSFLGWSAWAPLSKITFGAYLLHPMMLQIYNLSRPQPFHFTSFFQMFRHFVEAVVVSYGLSFVMSLAFERPYYHMVDKFLSRDKLNKLIFGRSGTPRPPKQIEEAIPLTKIQEKEEENGTEVK